MEAIGIDFRPKEEEEATKEEEIHIEEVIEKDLFLRVKKLERELDFYKIQINYVKNEELALRRELFRATQEVDRIKAVPLSIGQYFEMVDDQHAIISHGGSGDGHEMVRVLSTLDREKLTPTCSVAMHKVAHSIVRVLPNETGTQVRLLQDRPKISYADIGGLDTQKQEVRESVELPLTHSGLYEQIGIDPPRGVLLFGPPGCGKTMLAQAVAHHTEASFIRVVGSEFVKKYLGEGARMVRDVFKLARENQPCIVFIDECDAIASKRFDSSAGADREVQRILIELLNQMDGFVKNTDVKVIMATNRPEILDPAILRPGRLDRKIEFPLPDRRQKRLIFQVCSQKMNLSADIDLDSYVKRPEKLTGADIHSICQEAGMLAVRNNRYIVLRKDFEEAYKKVASKRDQSFDFY
ncbi:hypothetical protein PCE1_000221 [Barthelona sp. PCE]